MALTLLVAATAIALAARIAIWLPSYRLGFETGERLSYALIASAEDFAVIGAAGLAHLAAAALLPRLRTLWNVAFAALYAAIALIAAMNAVSISATGAVFELSWLEYLNLGDIGTTLPTLAAAMPPRLQLFLASVFIAAPLLYLVVGRLRFLTLGRVTAAALACGIAGFAGQAVIGLPAEDTLESSRSENALLRAFEALLIRENPSSRILRGTSGPDTHPDSSDWAVQPSHPPALGCCRGLNLVLITLDSVPYKRGGPEAVARVADRLPNLAWLYRSGVAFRSIYTPSPNSAPAFGALMTGIYPNAFAGEPLPGPVGQHGIATLGPPLRQAGFRLAHFMSGEVGFADADDYLDRRAFSVIEDSTSLRCSPDDARIFARYSRLPDSCTARHAAAWAATGGGQPFFLWLWLSNAHSPYFPLGDLLKADPTDTSLERYEESLVTVDRAIGVLLDRLRRERLLERTAIVLVADHGEAFGEHGMTLHSTSLHQEQVHVPMVIVAPGLKGGTSNDTLGNLVDVGPTLLDMAGLPSVAGWQGRSLFAPDHPKRTYFSKIRGGAAAGVIEGSRKCIVSILAEAPYCFDLARDPAELRPFTLSGAEARAVEARIGAFMTYRRRMGWSPNRP